MRCHNCGLDNKRPVTYCTDCGYALSQDRDGDSRVFKGDQQSEQSNISVSSTSKSKIGLLLRISFWVMSLVIIFELTGFSLEDFI